MKGLPLAEWVVYLPFDSAKECEAEREDRQQKNWRDYDRILKGDMKSLEKIVPKAELITAAVSEAQYWGIARCVASDDPRLRAR
jgi:hypothetical protein